MPQNGILQGKAEMKRIYERAAEWLCAVIGAGAAMMAGCCKEWYDSINNGEFGAADLLADAEGCMLGLAMTVL